MKYRRKVSLLIQKLTIISVVGIIGCSIPTDDGKFAPEDNNNEQSIGSSQKIDMIMPDGLTQSLSYEWINGLALHQGDIDLQLDSESIARRGLAKTGGAGVKNAANKWEGGVVAYKMGSGSAIHEANIYAAMQEWERTTMIRFRYENSGIPLAPIVEFVGTNEDFSTSPIGYQSFGGKITLGKNCSVANIIHEIGHTVGLFHEQSRSDRDSYVKIVWSNIKDDKEFNFDKYTAGLFPMAGKDVGPYDFTSRMHYFYNAFAIDESKPTIIALNGAKIASSSTLTRGDIATVRNLYSAQHAPMPLFKDRSGNLWTQLSWNLISNPVSFQQNGSRFAVVMGDKTLYVKENANGTWINESGNVTKYQIFGNRIGALLTDGTLYVKEGALTALWKKMDSGVLGFQLEGNRIAILKAGGSLLVKEGTLDAVWNKIFDAGAVDFQLESNRVGVRIANGDLYVKEGSLSALWVLEIGSVKNFQLNGTKIGVLLTDNNLYAKEGSLSATWAHLATAVKDFKIDGNQIGFRNSANALYAKSGISGVWYHQIDNVNEYTMWDGAISCVLSDYQLVSKRAIIGVWDKQWTAVGNIEQVNWK